MHFVVRKLQEEYRDEKEQYMYLVDLEKAFDRAPRRVIEWAPKWKS